MSDIKSQLPSFKNPWEFICWFFKELIKTFSNEPSYFASKRIERFFIFCNANIMLDIMVHSMLVKNEIDYLAACTIYGAQMLYAGYNTKQIFNEKPKTSIQTQTKDEVGDIMSAQTTENK